MLGGFGGGRDDFSRPDPLLHSTGDAFTFKLDAFLVAIMATLAVIALIDSIYKWYGYLLTGKREIVTSKVVEWAKEMEVAAN